MSDTSHLRGVLVMGASVLAMAAVPAPAMAQTSGAQPAAANQGAEAQVVVIAQHTATRLQKIPVAVSVFTSAQRDRTGIATVQDVTNFAPGFTYDTVTVNAGMRGVTRQNFNVTDDSRVTAYEDEFFVYSPYNLAESSLFLTQEQIERGPQNIGGRAAEGGSIDMIAVRPTDHPYAEMRATIGDYGAYEIEGAASDEIAPGLDARVVGDWNQQGQGYIRNVAGGSSEYHKVDEWHIEGSLDWKPSSNFELYARGYLSAWETDEGDAGTRQGPGVGSWDEVQLDDPNVGAADGSLYVNPNYGYAAIVPGAAAGAAAVSASQGPFGQELPIAATLKNPNILNNPTNPWDFAAVQPRTAELRNFNDLNYIMTYHLPSADIKYIGGFQGYDYTLNFADVDSDVTSFTLPGSAFGIQGAAAAGLEGALSIPAAAFTGLPTPSVLAINPTDHINFIENDWWTSHELSIQSTDSSNPLQYIAGVWYYYQQYSQPTIITANQANFAHPLSVTALGTAVPFLPSVIENPAFLAAANPSDMLLENSYQMETQSIAGYLSVSYKITDTLKLTGDLRVSNDRKWGNEEDRDVAFVGSSLASLYNLLIPLYGASTPSFDLTPLAVCLSGVADTVAHPNACNGGSGLAPGVSSMGVIRPNGLAFRTLSATDTEVTGGAGLEWTPTSDIFMYLRYSRGYAPLAFNSGFVSSDPEVNPEFLNSYEVGYKQSFGHTLSIDLAAFYYDYDQVQLPVTVDVNGILEGAFINYPKAESTGFEVEGTWNPIRDLVFTLSYSFDYTQLLTGCSGTGAGSLFVPSPGAECLSNPQDPDGTGPGARNVPNAPPGLQSVKGAPLPNAPENKLAVTGAYTFRFDPGNLTLALTYVWRDKQLGNTIFNAPYNIAPSWDDVDLRATWSGDHDRYEIIAFVKNVFNSLDYSTGAGGQGNTGNATTGFNPATGLNYVVGYEVDPPRTFGVELRYKFF